jgi:O-glycosyl hydrolase
MPFVPCRVIPYCLLIALSLSRLSDAATVAIDATRTYQSIDGFGACSAWISGQITRDLATIFWADDAINGHIGLSLLRTRIDPVGYTEGEAVPMKLAFQTNPAIKIWSTSWTPPPQFKDNGSLIGGRFNSDSASMRGFADHLVKYVQDVKKNAGIDLYAVSCQNEPDTIGNWDGCAWTGEQIRVFLKDYWGPACEKAGITAKRMIGESVRNSFAVTGPSLKDSSSAKYADIIGVQIYEGGPYPYPLVDSLKKAYWETEVCGLNGVDTSIANAVMWAGKVHDCLARCNMGAFHYWLLVNNTTTDDEGLCNASGRPTPRLFTLGNFSKFVRPGFVRIAATDSPAIGVKASAYCSRSSKCLVIVVVNGGPETKLDFAIPGIPDGKTAVPWLTDGTHRLERQSSVALSSNAFSYTVPSVSVATFVLGEVSLGVGAKCAPQAPPMVLRSGRSRLIQVPSAEKPWTVSIVTPAGRELMRKRLPEGCLSIAIGERGYRGVVCIRTEQDGIVRTSPLLLAR